MQNLLALFVEILKYLYEFYILDACRLDFFYC